MKNISCLLAAVCISGCIPISFTEEEIYQMFSSGSRNKVAEKTPLPPEAQVLKGVWGGIISRDYVCLGCTPSYGTNYMPIIIESADDGTLLVEHNEYGNQKYYCTGYLSFKSHQGNRFIFQQVINGAIPKDEYYHCYDGEVYFDLINDDTANYTVMSEGNMELKRGSKNNYLTHELKRIPISSKQDFLAKGEELNKISKKMQKEEFEKKYKKANEGFASLLANLSDKAKPDSVSKTSSGGGGVAQIKLSEIGQTDKVTNYIVICKNKGYGGTVTRDISFGAVGVIYNYLGLEKSTAVGSITSAIGDEKVAAERICE